MHNIGIVTDFTAQFPKPSFAGKQLVSVVPGKIQLNNKVFDNIEKLGILDFPISADDTLNPRLIPPSVSQFSTIFNELLDNYSEIVGIFISSSLSRIVANARSAAMNSSFRNRIHVLDSFSLSIGLGYLVQTAAEIANRNGSVTEIEQVVRRYSSKIYSIFCFPSTSYLIYSGILDKNQATISELLGLSPIYSMENGKLTPIQKEKNFRNIIDSFQEFLEEFDDLESVAFLRSSMHTIPEESLFHQYCKSRFKKPVFIEQAITIPMTVLFGPKSLGVTVVESIELV